MDISFWVPPLSLSQDPQSGGLEGNKGAFAIVMMALY